MKEEVERLIRIGEEIVQKKDVLGVDDIEVYISKTDAYLARVITSYVTTQTGIDAGVGVRVSIGKKVGFASVSSLDPEKIMEAAKKAADIARAKKEDPHFTHLPDPVAGARHHAIDDKKLMEVPPEELSNLLVELIKRTRDSAKNMKKVDIFFYKVNYAYAIVNSRGINVGDYGAFMGTWYELDLEDGGNRGQGIESHISRKYDVDAILGLPDKAVKMAMEGLKAQKISEPFVGVAIVTPDVLESLLRPLIYNVSAINVQEGRSRFIGKIGEKVASENLTIIDDGTLPEGISTNATDDEGIPMQRKHIIEKGTLRNYLYDTYTAYRENKKSTGNAKRNDYKSQPIPGQTNIIIENTTNKDLQGLISEVDKGVVLRGFAMGAHMINPIKGSMSITTLNALYVENGEVKFPIKAIAMSDDYFKFLSKVIMVGNDHKITFYGKIPTILVKEVHFA